MLEERVKSKDLRLPPEPTPFELAAAYLTIDPSKLEPELLVLSLLILLGPQVSASVNDTVAAALVDYLASEPKLILYRFQSEKPDVRSLKVGELDFTDFSVRGCLELVIGGAPPVSLMVKSPHAAGRARCRE
jgi:hypothetical protein